jgi:hypothetical protein
MASRAVAVLGARAEIAGRRRLDAASKWPRSRNRWREDRPVPVQRTWADRGTSEADARARQQSNTGSLADLSRRFWGLAVITGIAAGVGAIVMMAVLHSVQHVAFSDQSGEYSAAAARHGDLRRVAVLAAGGIVTGLGCGSCAGFSAGPEVSRPPWCGPGAGAYRCR